MNQAVQQTSNDYGIWVMPVGHEVKVYHGDTLLAVSANAQVMHETRLPFAIYIPKEDVCHPLKPVEEFRTFCPFKGSASYYDIEVNGEVLPKAAWSYEKAAPESAAVEGHIAFMPNEAIRIDHGGGTVEQMPSGNIAGPTVDWVMREAWLCKSPEELTAAVAKRFIKDGVALSRLSIMIWSLHPMIAGRNYVWSKATDEVQSFEASYDIHTNPAFVNSPLRHVSNGLGGVRQRLDGSPLEFDFPIIDDLKAQGATDYVAMPLPYSGGQINVMTLTSDHPKGFTTPNLGLVFECSSVISRYFEVFTLQENARGLLETYLGRRTGARVLGGEIRRGDGDEIQAAILFCDLRGSTQLEEQLGRDTYINLLNDFFETATNIINAHDGEVLKFIGDAVLAIFPAGDDKKAACARSLMSAQEIVSEVSQMPVPGGNNSIDCAIGIAYGEVTYGNIGSQERLDFTVIGGAANIAARLGDYGKSVGHRIVVSDDVAEVDANSQLLGEIALHNVSSPITTFAVADGINPSS